MIARETQGCLNWVAKLSLVQGAVKQTGTNMSRFRIGYHNVRKAAVGAKSGGTLITSVKV